MSSGTYMLTAKMMTGVGNAQRPVIMHPLPRVDEVCAD